MSETPAPPAPAPQRRLPRWRIITARILTVIGILLVVVSVLANYLRLIKAQKNLTWFTNFFGQAAVVFPFLVAAPRFFSGAIQLGELMQISSAFGQVQDSLSWFVENYSTLAAWRATTDRLTSFEASVAAQDNAEPSAIVKGPRIGVDYAKHWARRHLRFYFKGNRFVSRL